MAITLWEDLIKDYQQLYENKENYDVIIYSGEDNIELYAHSIILCCRSEYFRAAFSSNWAEKKDGIFILRKSNILPDIFEIILRFVYYGTINLFELKGSEILKLLIASDELGLDKLTKYTQEFLIKHQNEFLKNDSIEILKLIYQHETFTELWNFSLDALFEEPAVIFESPDFFKLSESLLESLLKRNDLLLEETIIWNKIIKWGLSRDETIDKDVSKWTQNDFNNMKQILYKFIPLIRFYDMTSEEFYKSVVPYRDLLPSELFLDILKIHMVSDAKPNVEIPPSRNPKRFTLNSTLINEENLKILTGWIELKDTKKYSYRFNLLYRNSQDSYDGSDVVSFHEHCDNKGPTLMIAKIKDKEHLFGGYTPLNWDCSDIYKSSSESFIFSITNNNNNIKTAKLGRIKNPQHSIFCYCGYGPTFGGGHDFVCQNYGIWLGNNPYSYSQINIPKGQFNVDDYEIFQVIKKELL
ncbi:hypothetical protein C1646_759478 [Rhizophagus diaphanus]|nr:hypothetical protein C1646_759478 [Rhizophagus diaphanus] [Rhizophagus sp. MUCL 43196]